MLVVQVITLLGEPYMFKIVLASVAALVLGVSAGSAAEFKGTVKVADKEKNTVTITVDGKDQTFTLGKDASIVNVKTVMGKKNKTSEEVTAIENGLDGLKKDAKVTILTEKQDDKEVATSIKVTDGATDAKKKKKKTT